jgi:hypothetical protein
MGTSSGSATVYRWHFHVLSGTKVICKNVTWYNTPLVKQKTAHMEF